MKRLLAVCAILFAVFLGTDACAHLIGVDFGRSDQATPTNWKIVSGFGTYPLLGTETGGSTVVDLVVTGTGGSPSSYGAGVTASTIPDHWNSLANIWETVYKRGTGDQLELKFTNLEAGRRYDVWVFGLRDGADLNQDVAMPGIPVFKQDPGSSDLFVNDALGSDATNLSAYAKAIDASGAGEIIITVTAISDLYAVAGVAIDVPTPTVTTQAVTGVGTTTATGNGNITDLGDPNPTQHGVCWNTTGTPTTEDSKTEEGAASGTGAFTSNMTGLSNGTTYYVRAYATNAVGTEYGKEVTFQTPQHYMAKFAGDWSSTSIWFTNTTGGTNPDDYITPATEAPNATNALGIIINSDVAVDADVTIDQTTINSGYTLSIQGGVTLAIADGTGTDLTVTGTLTNSGTVACASGSAVNFNGDNQTIPAIDYSTLSFTGSTGGSTKTFADGTTKVDTDILLTDDVTLTGSSADNVTVQVTTPAFADNGDSNDSPTASRVFNVDADGKTVTISNMTIRGGDVMGSTNAQGGCILHQKGTLNLDSVVVGDAKAFNGGGIAAFDQMSISDSTIRNNSAFYGAALHTHTDQTVTLSNTTISGNSATFSVVIWADPGDLVLTDVTVFGNEEAWATLGCVTLDGGTSAFKNVTIAGNTTKGAGLFLNSGALTIRNSLLANNVKDGPGADYFYNGGTLTDLGYNVVEDQSGDDAGEGKTFTHTTDILYNTKADGTTGYTTWNQNNTDLENQTLGLASSLADNGGPTQTLALGADSFARGAIPYADEGAGVWNGARTTGGNYYDQRGAETIPSDPICIGACEFHADYITKSAGAWENPASWNIFNGVTAKQATVTPNAANSTSITVDHNTWIAAENLTIDQTTVNAGNTLTVDSNGGGIVLTIADGAGVDLNVSGGLVNKDTITCEAGSTVDFAGGNQTIPGGDDVTWHNLTTSGTGTKTLGGDAALAGNLEIGNGTTLDASGNDYGIFIAGNWVNNGTFTARAGEVQFFGASAQTISGDNAFFGLTISKDDPAGTVDASGSTLAVTNGLSVTVGVFTSASTYKDVLITPFGTLILSGDITVSGQWWSILGNFTHNNHTVTLNGTDQEILGSTTFYNLTKQVAAADTLTFEDGETTSIQNALTLQGAAGQLLSLRSTASGIQWKVNPANSPTIAYLDVKDSNNTSGTDINAVGTNSVDSGNNDGWFFNRVPAISTQAVSGIGINAATGNGNITDLGIPNPTAHGVCWSTSANPTTSDSKKDKGAATSTGAFTAAITGLGAATDYHVRAYATNTAGTSYGDDVTFTTLPNPPGVPVAKAATASNATGFTANWSAVSGADTYRLDVSTTSDFSTYVTGYQNKYISNVTSSAVTGLSGGHTYYYRVRAVNTGGTSGNSNQITAATLCSAPVATVATSVIQTGFTANWNASTGATGYRLDVSTNSAFSSYVTGYQNKDVGNVTSSAVTGLTGGTSYYYRVRAENSGGSSAHSNTISVETSKLPTQVGLTGPATVNAAMVSTAFTLTSRDKNGDSAAVTENTVFALSSSSTGTAAFYRDATGKLAITQTTIVKGSSSAIFYYGDTAAGTPTVTATRVNGMALGSDVCQITVVSGTVSGTVYNDLNGNGVQDPGEPGIRGVTVDLLSSRGSLVQTTTTDGNGAYRFSSVAPGSYMVQETDPEGYTSTTSNNVPISAAANGSATANFGDQDQGTISGNVFLDTNGNGIQDLDEPGISGVTVTLLTSQGGSVETATTGADGRYRFTGVNSGSYTVQEKDPKGFTSTTNNRVPLYIGAGGSATANFGDQDQGTVSGNVFLDTNGNGMQDANEPGISGVTVTLLTSRESEVQTATTAGNGSYSFSGVTSGGYKVQETDPAGYISTTANTVPVSVTGAGGVTANFGDQEEGTVSGIVFADTNGNGARNEFEKGITGVTVTLLSGGTVSSTTTSGDGSYRFAGLSAGVWTVQETDPEGYDSTTDNTVNVNVGSESAATANFGDIPYGTVSGVVFNDTNGNRVQDPGEKGVGGVTVNLRDNQDALYASMVTVGDGAFLFSGVAAGTYTVEEIYPTGYTGTTTNRVVITVGEVENASGTMTAFATRDVAAANFGVLQQESISGIVFNDANGNGIQDTGENGVGGVEIQLLSSGEEIAATTAGDGSYSFYNVAPGNYTIQETYPEGYTGTTSRSVCLILAEEGAATANFGILQGEAPDHVTLTGPVSVLSGSVSQVFTLNSRDGEGNSSNVTADTAFALSSTNTGTAAFYSDAEGATSITQVSIAEGNNKATFYYKDTQSGWPTVTATWLSGGTDLGNAHHELKVIAVYAGYIYVSKDGTCGGKTPCYATIQEAVDAAGTDYAIRIGRGTYDETVILDTPKDLTLQGGWDPTFTTQTLNTTFMNSPVVLQGSITLQMITVASGFLYVSKDGICGEMTPCFTSIQEAVDTARSGDTIQIAMGAYKGTIVLDAPKDLILRGGWDALFTTQTPNSTLIVPPVAKQGAISLQMVSIQP